MKNYLCAGLLAAAAGICASTAAKAQSYSDNTNYTQLLETYLGNEEAAITAYNQNVSGSSIQQQDACIKNVADMTAFVNKTISQDPFAPKSAAYAIINEQILTFDSSIDFNPCPSPSDVAQYGNSAFSYVDPVKNSVIQQAGQIELNLDLRNIIFYQAVHSTGYASPNEETLVVTAIQDFITSKDQTLKSPPQQAPLYQACLLSETAVKNFIEEYNEAVLPTLRNAANQAQAVMQRLGAVHCHQ